MADEEDDSFPWWWGKKSDESRDLFNGSFLILALPLDVKKKKKNELKNVRLFSIFYECKFFI